MYSYNFTLFGVGPIKNAEKL